METAKILKTSKDGAILYQYLTPKYLNNACDLIRKTLFTNGDVYKTFRVTDDSEVHKELDQILKCIFKDGVTVIAVQKNTNEVVGAIFNKILIKSDKFYENFRDVFKNPKCRKIMQYRVDIENMCNLFDYCQVDCLIEVAFAAVLPEFRDNGIGTKLFKLCLETAQELYNSGEETNQKPVPKIVKANFVSANVQKCAEEFDFCFVVERSNRQIQVDGEVFENPSPSTETMKVGYRRLDKHSSL